MFAVSVTFVIRDDHLIRFLALVRDNAGASLREEPGCLRFDVCRAADRPHEVFLYEVYAAPSDFDNHCKMPHFKAFKAATEHMVVDKQIRCFEEVWP